jgi:hypothetical protein
MGYSAILRSSVWKLVVIALATTLGCGGSGRRPQPPTCSGDCSCIETTCTCQAGGTCSFGGPATGSDGDGDGGTASSGMTGTTAPPDDVTYHCDTKNECDLTCGTGCTATCDGRSTCAGSCSANCTSSCAGTSQCTLTTGVNSEVTCAGGSTCQLTLDTGSTIKCQGDSTCNINCPKGGCAAECAGSAGCTVVCGGTEACTIECNGTKVQDCPSGSTCNGVCTGPPSGDGGAVPDAARGRG